MKGFFDTFRLSAARKPVVAWVDCKMILLKGKSMIRILKFILILICGVSGSIANGGQLVASESPELSTLIQEIPSYNTNDTTERTFGGWSLDKKLYNYIRKILADGKTILEFGSGWASGKLSKHYTVYSIEHDPIWLNRYNTHYIYAPIVNNWYDVEILKNNLPDSYDLIIVDGPPHIIGRRGFFNFLHLFNTNVPIIFDDVNRRAEYELLKDVANKLNKPYIILKGSTNKQFGIVS